MKENNEKIPSPKELEKEIGEFLTKKFGDNVKVVSPIVIPQTVVSEKEAPPSPKKEKKLSFDLKPEDLISYLDQYIVKQANAKAILSTKICTHFNRIKHAEASPDKIDEIVGSIKDRNVRSTGGTLQSLQKEQTIVTIGQFQDPLEVKNVIVRSSYEKQRIYIKDIASVKNGAPISVVDSIKPNKKSSIIPSLSVRPSLTAFKTV